MFLRELTQPVTHLRGAGKAVAARLARLGIFSVADLLLHYPRDYDDRSTRLPFASARPEGRVHTAARVLAHEWFGFGRMRTLKVRVEDDSGEAVLVCFNRPFLEKSLPVGAQVLVTGSFRLRYGELQSSSFEAVPLDGEGGVEEGILPVYPATEGLAQGSLRTLQRRALAEYGSLVEDELPTALLTRRGLLRKREALRALHFPASSEELAQGRESLVYEELFFFQLAVAQRAGRRREETRIRSPGTGRLKRRLLERLPYSLTPDQERSSAEIALDLASARPMARLLQGDVGSGKTLVAFLAALDVIEAGGQVALMAPTELLARQHAENAALLLEPLGVRLAFLTGNVEDAARPPLLAALARGEVDFVLGTQALFSGEVAYRKLSLAIVDEQHRFGVLQRAALSRKGAMPDLLLMTATPIPRTLALTIFGDLDVSTIRTMPPGRKPIVTHLARTGNEGKVYDFVRRELAAGRQAYFVYPLVGESERLELKNAEAMLEHLSRQVYPEFKVGMIHARLKDEEKRAAMTAFRRGGLDILVATSVVEVGVDVPNATIMVIEHAERFGLAALHQLRGRVGRGEAQSYCFLVYSDGLTAEAKERLKAMLESTDGFALAERDLEIRGPGELMGTSQSGYLRLSIADPLRDTATLERAREDAFALIAQDPGLLSAESQPLREVFRRTDPFGERNSLPAS